MSASKTVESGFLMEANNRLNNFANKYVSNPFEARLQILEACASHLGGYELKDYNKAFKVKSLFKEADLEEYAGHVLTAIQKAPIHSALALSILAREALSEANRKMTGAYHTDFRLAQRLAEHAAPKLTPLSKAIDPACGSGILLVALTIQVCGDDRKKISKWFSDGICAADLSENSLRGALLALSSLTNDIAALKKMRKRWYCGDSLLAEKGVWMDMSVGGFDAVVGNPPWEKIKLTRHEFIKSNGIKRHYGDENTKINEKQYSNQKSEIADYSKNLLLKYPDLGRGEPDLYIAFTELFYNLCRPGGIISALVPGGLIRSQGTEAIRHTLFNGSQSITISIIDNRARFFEIDSRFKFLAITLQKNDNVKSKITPIILLHERGRSDGLDIYGSVKIGRPSLITIRRDLSIPEVRNTHEWRIFQRIFRMGCNWDDKQFGWDAQFCREVDMTKEKPHFFMKKVPNSLAVIEGRMVQHHRFGAKRYLTGTGRRAVWQANPIGKDVLHPQFWIKEKNIPTANLLRSKIPRAGFCDIAGQTNERSLMASIIPSGVICGNKVPTILFPSDPSEERLLAWVAIANSIPFDWMLRRILTTTVNYFVLQSIPLPKLSKNGLPWKNIVACSQELGSLGDFAAKTLTSRRMAYLRAQIDAEIAVAYGLDLNDLELMLSDFPILDRGQPALPNEIKSTVTRDTLLAVAAKRMGKDFNLWQARVKQACDLGAVAYIPYEFASDIKEYEEQIEEQHYA